MEDLNALPLPALLAALTADGSLERLLDLAFQEDGRSPGDITSQSIIGLDQRGTATMTSREAGIVAGLGAIPSVAARFPSLRFDLPQADGDACAAGQRLAELNGLLRDILLVERVLLNLVGRLSGVATLTRRFVDAVAGAKAVICDTRKTTPGMRAMEKYAVRCGGGTMHRVGLFDAALYKDNHLAGIPPRMLASHLGEAVRHIRDRHDVRFVEVEVDRLDQLQEITRIEPGMIDFVLLDNMPPAMLREAVAMRDAAAPRLRLEASGGVNLETVRAIAEAGVDRISVGALTHSAKCLDVGLDIEG